MRHQVPDLGIHGRARRDSNPQPADAYNCQAFNVVRIGPRPGMIASRLSALVRLTCVVVRPGGSHVGSQRPLPAVIMLKGWMCEPRAGTAIRMGHTRTGTFQPARLPSLCVMTGGSRMTVRRIGLFLTAT